MLRPKRDEVMYRGSVVPLNIRTEELAGLGESNCVETVLEFCDVGNLFSGKVDLFVDVPILQCFDE